MLMPTIRKFADGFGGWLRMLCISRPSASSTIWLSFVPGVAIAPSVHELPPSSL